MNTAVQDIKDRLKIEDVVAQYVPLKKTGRSLKGLCPFHAEKTPSFVVSPDRGIAYCFGCHKGGDIFSFVQEIEGMEFKDALKMLAEKSGVELDDREILGSRPRVNKDEKAQLLQLYEEVTCLYEQQLWEMEPGKKVLGYLRKRGLTDESIKAFRLGFSVDSFDGMYPIFLKKGFTKKLLVQAGLALSKETTVNKIYDRFRGRLMFPICDHLGRVVAFGGRALSKEQEPKYVNSPEYSLYHKSRVLYGFHKAKQVVRKQKTVVLVEGYMDVIAAVQADVPYTVASCGTAMTAQQLRLLKPFVEHVVLAFDNDLAGQDAARRAYGLAQELGIGVKAAVIPDGKDPADYVREHDNFADIVEKAELYTEVFYKQLLASYGADDITSKRKIVEEFLPFLTQMRSRIEQDDYVRRLALDLGLKEVHIYDEMRNFRLPQEHPAKLEPVVNTKKHHPSETFIGFLLEFPRIGVLLFDQLKEGFFCDEVKPIYKALADQYNDHGLESIDDIMSIIPLEYKEYAALLSLYVAETYGEISEVEGEKELKALLAHMRRQALTTKRRTLQDQLIQAEQAQDRQQSHKLLQQLHDLNSEMALI